MRNFGFKVKDKKLYYNIESAIMDVEEYISNLFEIYKMHNHTFLFINDKKRIGDAADLLRKRYEQDGKLDVLKSDVFNNEKIREEMENYGGLCLFTGDFHKEYDYVIFVPDLFGFTPNIIGEEIAHGEHYSLHAVKDGKKSFNAYNEKFHGVSTELVGALAYYDIFQHIDNFVLECPCSKGLYTKHDIEDYIARNIAKAIIDYSIDISFKELFHAENEEKMWDVVNKGGRTSFIVEIQYDPPKNSSMLEYMKKEIIDILEESKAKGVVVEMNIEEYGKETVSL